MPKKNYTPEERKAIGDRLRAARLKAQADRITNEDPSPSTSLPAEDGPQDLSARLDALVEEIRALKAEKAAPERTPDTPKVDARGSLVGRFEKYITDSAHYPNPSERLSQEPRLGQFAFPLNWELDFKTRTSSYTTLDGVHTVEPRFELELRGIKKDDQGNPTPGRWVAKRMVFHEDPEAALTEARRHDANNLIEEMSEASFLNEMRYLRMRDWLFNCFYPEPFLEDKQNKREEVIGNRLVEVFEISSDSAAKIPFDQISKKF